MPEIRLDLRQPHQHLVAVTLTIRPRQPVRLRLPAWTPGSYLIRDYVRNIEGLQAHRGDRPLPLRRTGVAAWEVGQPDDPAAGWGADDPPLTLHYRVQATELSVRTCHLNADHGFLALAAVVLQVEGERWEPHSLELLLPDTWQAFVPLPQGADGRWQASDFDQLIDAPIEAGPHPEHGFTVLGTPHRWVSWGDDLPRLDPAWLDDVARVCAHCCQLMGERAPAAASYLFVLHLLERGFGGLEHDDGCVLQFSRRQLEQPAGRRKLLQLVAHEYLHQWNVRRLRPMELRPYDYDHPTIIPSLWFAEGITSYFDQLLPMAAGLTSEQELLEDLGADLSRYLLTPGRAVQNLRLSSQEAWVKLYRQDAHASDNQMSYYLKGAVVALVLDVHLRRRGSCLGAVLQRLWRSHGRQARGYSEADLLEAFSEQAPELRQLLPVWLEDPEDPPLNGALADLGLRLRPELADQWYAGWEVDPIEGLLQLKRVVRQGPAQRAGLQLGDELLALAGRRLRSPACVAAALRWRADAPAPDLPVLISRDGQVRQLQLHPDPPVVVRWHLEIDPDADADAVDRRRRWGQLLP